MADDTDAITGGMVMVEAVAVVEVGAFGNENGDVGLGVKCHPRGHHLGQAFHRPCGEKQLGEQVWQASHCSMQGDRLLWLCVGTSHPCAQKHCDGLCPCAQKLSMMAGV